MAELGRVVIADDDETFFRSTAELLEREGYRCSYAPSAVVARNMLREGGVGLLIADDSMPGNTNLELVWDVVKAAEGTPVILVTELAARRSTIESVPLPVAAYLVKPVDPGELTACVRAAVERYCKLQAIRTSLQRVEDWSDTLGRMKEAARPPLDVSALPISTFFELTLQNVATALLDIKHLTEAIAAHQGGGAVCHLFNCPRSAALIEALKETVAVLEKTKSSFRSKELGALRRKLEGLIRDWSK